MTLGPVNLPPPAVRELLAAHAAARQRTSDDHMFTLTVSGMRAGTFRLQLFTAPGARPVAVATQYFPGEGDPLGTWAEYTRPMSGAGSFPGSAEPPVWISLRLDPGQQDAPPEPFTL